MKVYDCIEEGRKGGREGGREIGREGQMKRAVYSMYIFSTATII